MAHPVNACEVTREQICKLGTVIAALSKQLAKSPHNEHLAGEICQAYDRLRAAWRKLQRLEVQ